MSEYCVPGTVLNVKDKMVKPFTRTYSPVKSKETEHKLVELKFYSLSI